MKTFFVDTKSDLVFEYEDESEVITFPNGQKIIWDFRHSEIKTESTLKLLKRFLNMIKKEFIELD